MKDVTHTSAVHKLTRTFRDRRVLVRGFTQNIDSLESREDLCCDLGRGFGSQARFTRKSLALPYEATHLLPKEALDGGCEIVQLHGDLDCLRCTICPNTSDGDGVDVEACFRRGEAPPCPHCTNEAEGRRARGKRSSAIGRRRSRGAPSYACKLTADSTAEHRPVRRGTSSRGQHRQVRRQRCQTQARRPLDIRDLAAGPWVETPCQGLRHSRPWEEIR